jgi:hypothetical protein
LKEKREETAQTSKGERAYLYSAGLSQKNANIPEKICLWRSRDKAYLAPGTAAFISFHNLEIVRDTRVSFDNYTE